MSATQLAADLIAQRGSGTADDILADMGGLTRDQVFRALRAAAERGLIFCDGVRVTPGIHGGTPCTYRSEPSTEPKREPIRKRKPKIRRCSSVWEYAQRASL